MPYKSNAQRRFFNSETGRRGIGEKEVNKWNKESKGLKLPEKIGDAVGATPKEEFYRLSNYIDSLVKEKAHPKYIKREVNSIKKGIPSKVSSNVLTKELGRELNKKINQVLRQIEVKDAINGSVQDFLDMMQGKNQFQVEQIIKKAKGNPNADEAYRRWKKQNIKDAIDYDYYTVFIKAGPKRTSLPVKNIKANELPIREVKKFMKENGHKEVMVRSKFGNKEWKVKDSEPEYDPITKTMKVKTCGSEDSPEPVVFAKQMMQTARKVQALKTNYERDLKVLQQSFNNARRQFIGLNGMESESMPMAQEAVAMFNKVVEE